MNRTISITATLLLAASMAFPASAHAAGMGDDSAMPMAHGMKGMFLTKRQIDGYTVSFHVMKARTGHPMGGDHDFMVKVEKDGQVRTDLIVNSKVGCPDGSTASKMMMRMGDWYAAGYDMGQHGRYQLMVLFKTPDGGKHFGGVYFPR